MREQDLKRCQECLIARKNDKIINKRTPHIETIRPQKILTPGPCDELLKELGNLLEEWQKGLERLLWRKGLTKRGKKGEEGNIKMGDNHS